MAQVEINSEIRTGSYWKNTSQKWRKTGENVKKWKGAQLVWYVYEIKREKLPWPICMQPWDSP